MNMKNSPTSIRRLGTLPAKRDSPKRHPLSIRLRRLSTVHEQRFAKLAEMLESGTWYQPKAASKWMCTNCGYIHEGNQAPPVCPVCRHEQGYFIPYEMACYKID